MGAPVSGGEGRDLASPPHLLPRRDQWTKSAQANLRDALPEHARTYAHLHAHTLARGHACTRRCTFNRTNVKDKSKMHDKVVDICGVGGKLTDDKGKAITTCSDAGSDYLVNAIKAKIRPTLDKWVEAGGLGGCVA